MQSENLYTDVIISTSIPTGMWLANTFFAPLFSTAWYKTLHKPLWQPPGWLFGAIWPILYICIGIALFLMLRAHTQANVSRVMVFSLLLHICLHLSWTGVFLYGQYLLAAAIILAAMVGTLSIAMAYVATISRTAFIVLIPYWGWITFATTLNFATWYLNS